MLPALTIAYQGEPGAFSEQALLRYFGPSCLPSPSPTFVEVFRKVERGRADHGVVPLENSQTGTISECCALLYARPLFVTGEVTLRVVHSLLGRKNATLKSIRRVLAFPQAVLQCRDFLSRHPNWKIELSHDTAGSARLLSRSGNCSTAAIAHRDAASRYGLQVLRSGIENDHRNRTRFIVLSRQPLVDPRLRRTAMIYAVPDRPGALLRTLRVFARHRVNLRKLESRPRPGRPFEYFFFVEAEGNSRNTKMRQVWTDLRPVVTFRKFLGDF